MPSLFKPMNYGHSMALMILASSRMGLEPALTGVARAQLKGDDVHPMNGAAMEREASRLNDLVRRGGQVLVDEANGHVGDLKREFGFLPPASPASTH